MPLIPTAGQAIFDPRSVTGANVLFDINVQAGVTQFGSYKGINTVATLRDRWNPAYSWSQSTPSLQPPYIQNLFNGFPGVTVNGHSLVGNQAVLNALASYTGLTVYTVYRTLSSTDGFIFFTSKNASTSLRHAVSTGSTSSGSHQIGGRTGDDSGSPVFCIGSRSKIPEFSLAIGQLDLTNNLANMYKNGALTQTKTAMWASGQPVTTAPQACWLFNSPSGSPLNGDFVHSIVCTGVHSQATIDAMTAGLNAQYNIAGQVAYTGALRVVQFHGDSITAGSALQLPNANVQEHQNLGYELWLALTASNTATASQTAVLNFGWSGATVVQLAAERAAMIDTLPQNGVGKIVYVFYAGTNDIAAGTTGAAAYTNIKALFQATKTGRTGYTPKIIICGPVARGGLTSGQFTEMGNLLTQINTNAVTDGADAVVDFQAGIPNLAASSISDTKLSDRSIYVDATVGGLNGVHPTNGYLKQMAQLIKTQIIAVGG